MKTLTSSSSGGEYRNPSFGLATKAKGLQGCKLRGSSKVKARGSLGVKARGSPGVKARRSLGVTSHTPKSVRIQLLGSFHSLYLKFDKLLKALTSYMPWVAIVKT